MNSDLSDEGIKKYNQKKKKYNQSGYSDIHKGITFVRTSGV